MRLYPKTFPRLLLISFVLAALPLVVALLRTSWSVQQLSEQGRNAVGQSTQATRATLQLVDESVGLERLARQYLVLAEVSQLEDYRTMRYQFKATTSELALLPLNESLLAQLNQAVELEENLFAQLSQSISPNEHGKPLSASQRIEQKTSLTKGYAELSQIVQQMLLFSRTVGDREVNRLTAKAEEIQIALTRPLWIMLGLGLGLMLLATFVITRPIRRLEQSIKQLGDNKLDDLIQVSGPSDLERLGEQLDWLRRRLQELEAQKARFLRHVSHELKTPLTSLREGADLLADGTAGRLNPQQQEIVQILRVKSVDLQRLIEKLLDTQRMLEGMTVIKRTPVVLDRIVRQVVDAHRLSASSREIQFQLLLVQAEVEGDAEKLATIVDNLISNALKYSPTGGKIGVHVLRDRGRVVLDVQDNGPGVREEDRERVFDWFYRSTSTATTTPTPGSSTIPLAGTGMGLAIARELAQTHHGQLVLMPPPHQGDTHNPPLYTGAHFRLILPVSQGRMRHDDTPPTPATTSLPDVGLLLKNKVD